LLLNDTFYSIAAQPKNAGLMIGARECRICSSGPSVFRGNSDMSQAYPHHRSDRMASLRFADLKQQLAGCGTTLLRSAAELCMAYGIRIAASPVSTDEFKV